MLLFCPRVVIFPALLVVWCIQRWPGQCCGTIKKIIGSPPRQFYADAIEEAPGVKVRVILGSIQMRWGQYTPRQMSELISSFFAQLEEVRVCVCVFYCGLCSLLRDVPLLCGVNESQRGVEHVAIMHLRKLEWIINRWYFQPHSVWWVKVDLSSVINLKWLSRMHALDTKSTKIWP